MYNAFGGGFNNGGFRYRPSGLAAGLASIQQPDMSQAGAGLASGLRSFGAGMMANQAKGQWDDYLKNFEGQYQDNPEAQAFLKAGDPMMAYKANQDALGRADQNQQFDDRLGMMQDEMLYERSQDAEKIGMDQDKERKDAAKLSFDQEKKLRDEFDALAKPYRQAIDQHNVFKSVINSGTPGSDMASVYSFMKILDPSSVVREGEFATAAAAQGLSSRGVNYIKQIMNGTKLSPEQRSDFALQVENMMKARGDEFFRSTERFKGMSGRYNLNQDNIIDSSLLNRSQETPAIKAPELPVVGERRGGYQYIGGEPGSAQSWKKI